MTHFLWVEDFKASEKKDMPPMMEDAPENIVSSTVKLVFGNILDTKELEDELAEEDARDARDFLVKKGIFLKLNLLEALEFINDLNELSKIDFVILDFDMPVCYAGQTDKYNYLPDLIEQYGSESELSRIAGYQLYIHLVIELGFPKSHILFCSNNARYFKGLTDKFNDAKIKLPVSPNPDKPFLEKDDKEYINQWLDNAHSDYFVLRRGIIDACNDLENKTSDAELQEYFFGLKRYLPLKEPNPTEKESIYLHLVRAIVHDWDDKGHPIPDRRVNPIGNTLGWLLRTARNWLAHDSLLNNFDEKTIAFIFLINVRLLANLEDDKLEPFELKLLSLFDKNTLSQAEINKLKIFYKEAIDVCQNNNLNFINKYYNQLVNDFHENSIDNCDYTKLLFRVFMFAIYQQNPSFPRTTNTANPNSPFLDYQVRFVKRNNLPCYLEEFEKRFYPLAV